MTISKLPAALALWLSLQAAVFAISVETVNLQSMVASADRIFYGRCLEAIELVDDAIGFPVVHYRFRVHEALKGVRAGDVVEFRQLSGSHRQLAIPGMPGFRKGQELLVFLHPDSGLGLTSPVGLLQGIFRPERQEDGALHFRNGLANQNLDVGLDETAPAVAALTLDERRALRGEQPLTLDLMRRLVLRLDGGSREVR